MSDRRKHIGVAYADQPIGGRVFRDVVSETAGLTVEDLVKRVPNLPARFWQQGVVCINDMPVDRRYWKRVKPKAHTKNGTPVTVTMHLAPAGGGGGAKKILSIVAAIAIIVATAFIGAGGLAFLGPAFAAGSFGASLAAAAVATVGTLALQALTPPPTVNSPEDIETGRSDGGASADGNLLNPGGVIPRVVGTHRVYPPVACQPLVDFYLGAETIEALYTLAGPHQMQDIKVDGIGIESIVDLEYQVRQGFITDNPITLIERYAHTNATQTELSQHVLKPDDKTHLLHGLEGADLDLPIWHTFVSRLDPDEIWLHLVWPSGIIDGDNVALESGMPIRLRMRPVGTSDWINLPEFHMRGRKAETFRKYIKLIWSSIVSDVPADEVVDADASDTFTRGFHSVPEQTAFLSNPRGGWTADSHFVNSSTITDLDNVRFHFDGVKLYLYGTTFPRGHRWEIGVIRGQTFDQDQFLEADYTYDGIMAEDTVFDFFGYSESGGVNAVMAMDQEGVNDKVNVQRVVSVYHRHPVAQNPSKLALLAIKGRARQLNKVSILASGLVPDWDGTVWTGLVPTSNPAPHFREVLRGELNPDPVPAAIIDDTGLVAWRSWCISQGHECNAIIDSSSVMEALTLIASCGRARPLMSDIWGVIVDQYRALEPAVTIFSPRNSSDFAFEKILPERAHAFRVKYRNIDLDYEDDEVIVFDPRIPEEQATKFEEITYAGLVYEDSVTSRARFDIDQSYLRSVTYSLKTDIESLVCRRGDIVGVAHDVIHRHAGFGRVKIIEESGDNTVSITLDNEATLPDATSFFSTTNTFDMDNVFDVGLPMAMAIRLTDGSIITHALDTSVMGTVTEFTFATPFETPDTLQPGCHAVVGPFEQVFGRYIVTEILPATDLTAQLILVDEAPTLHGDEVGYPWSDETMFTDSFGWSF